MVRSALTESIWLWPFRRRHTYMQYAWQGLGTELPKQDEGGERGPINFYFFL